MPRTRNPKSRSKVPPHIDPAKLPAGCYFDHRGGNGRWYFRQFDNGKLTKPVRIGDGDTRLPDLWAAADALAEKTLFTFAWLSDKYRASIDYSRLADLTRSDYLRYHKRICATPMRSGSNLGDLSLSWWTVPKVQRYLDKRAEQGAPVAGNREASYMQTVFRWGQNRGHLPSEIGNPAIGPKRNKEQPRVRYVEDWEYQFVLDLARTRASWYVPYVMEIMYLCRCRQIEALSLDQFQNIQEDGLLIERRKGSRSNITRWSPRLRAAIDGAMKDPRRPVTSGFIFAGKDSNHIRSTTFQSAWQRLMKAAIRSGLKESFTSEDLKPKGTTDTEGNSADKMAATGHKTTSMITRIYDRKPAKVPPVK